MRKTQERDDKDSKPGRRRGVGGEGTVSSHLPGIELPGLGVLPKSSLCLILMHDMNMYDDVAHASCLKERARDGSSYLRNSVLELYVEQKLCS